MPRTFLLGLLVALATAGSVVAVIGWRLAKGPQYLWILVPVVVLVVVIAVMVSQGTKSKRSPGDS